MFLNVIPDLTHLKVFAYIVHNALPSFTWFEFCNHCNLNGFLWATNFDHASHNRHLCCYSLQYFFKSYWCPHHHSKFPKAPDLFDILTWHCSIIKSVSLFCWSFTYRISLQFSLTPDLHLPSKGSILISTIFECRFVYIAHSEIRNCKIVLAPQIVAAYQHIMCK
jgi:hypothetical protein